MIHLKFGDDRRLAPFRSHLHLIADLTHDPEHSAVPLTWTGGRCPAGRSPKPSTSPRSGSRYNESARLTLERAAIAARKVDDKNRRSQLLKNILDLYRNRGDETAAMQLLSECAV